MDNNNKNKITGIDNIDIITNGTADQFKTINNADQVGHIIDTTTQNIVSETTPLFMIIVQHRRGWEKLLNILVENGGNLDRQINFLESVSAGYFCKEEALEDAARAHIKKIPTDLLIIIKK